ncbi:nucleolar and coiled-body phosphoprotein 1 [Pempheris klunzingeri]|uniref:nucleolar and coiled-body phosphoprotein 1 n=1 Tax=Pempheris klunzingeri TaxID=3127111 RepID=UPI0039815967
MDSSSVLRQQSQNKIHTDFLRVKNEHNKMPAHPKSTKLLSAPHLPIQDAENQDPGNSDTGRKAPVRPGVSRLPVLAKSLRLQTPSDFTQSHCRWEEKPLAGKAKKSKPCTRPIPFNLSQPKSSRMATKNQQPPTVSQSRTGTCAVQPDNNVCTAHLKAQNINAKPAEHPVMLKSNVDSTKSTGKPSGKSGQSGPSNTFSATLSNPLSSIPNNAMHQNRAASSAQPGLSADACLDNINQLSLKDPTKTAHASQNMQPTPQSNFSKSSTDKGENFQPDHAALLSILRNEGVSATGLGSATPQSKSYNYLPQRVSVMKSRQKAGPTTGLMKSVQFSPDPAALQSILLNEGVKAGGPVGATPRNSVRPSGRGTSIYTAQRVPLKKNHVEAAGGPVAVALKETPLKKWTPQRVRDTRHQPMSAMKWHLSTQQSPYAGTPALRSSKTNPQPLQEEVVQRLFDDHEDEQSTNVTDKDPETQAEPLPVELSATKSHCEEKVETGRASSDKDEEEEETEQEQRTVGGQPFLQAPQRESVIFFSTGKKLLRAPRFEKKESSGHHEQHGPSSSDQRKMLPLHKDTSSVSEPPRQINPPVHSLHRDLIVQKTCALSPALALLRKRLPPLEELRMDEEVATYTSVSVPAASGFLPPRPRCGNPLASILCFEESSRFVPIVCDLSSEPSSPQSSPLQER